MVTSRWHDRSNAVAETFGGCAVRVQSGRLRDPSPACIHLRLIHEFSSFDDETAGSQLQVPLQPDPPGSPPFSGLGQAASLSSGYPMPGEGERKVEDAMTRNPVVRCAAAIALAAALLLTASCGDDEPEPVLKTSTSSPTPSVSPAPSKEPLSSDQKKAFNAAVDRYAEFQRFVERVGREPKVTKEMTVELAGLATKPATDEFSDGLDELIRNDAHTEGQREVAWSSPVSVEDDEVVFVQCETPGTWVLVGADGDRVPQEGSTVTKVTAIEFEDEWYIKDADQDGRC